jgi:hypothetical protein
MSDLENLSTSLAQMGTGHRYHEKKKSRTCYKCHKKGHLIATCPELNNGEVDTQAEAPAVGEESGLDAREAEPNRKRRRGNSPEPV